MVVSLVNIQAKRGSLAERARGLKDTTRRRFRSPSWAVLTNSTLNIGVNTVDRFLDDLRYGFRLLLKAPTWSAVVVATLMLVIGLSTGIFSLTNSLLLNALPYPGSERLATLWTTSANAAAANVARFNASSANWLDWRRQSKLFEDIALTKSANFNLTGDGPPERVLGARASSNLLRVLGIEPVLGRMSSVEEELSDARVAVVSFGFWQRRFGGDPDVLGSRMQLNGETYEVIGVLPPELRYPTEDFEVIAPLFIPESEVQSRMAFSYKALGRLKPGVSVEQAQAEISTIMDRLAEEYPGSNGMLGLQALVEPLLETSVGSFRKTLYVLIAAVASLLLVGCINLSGLLIVRASAREREFTLRAALGASPGGLRRQALAEVLPLGLLGGLGGVLLAWWLLKVLVPLLPERLPIPGQLPIDFGLLGFSLVLGVVVVLVAGLLPARSAARAQLSGTLQGTRTVTGGSWFRNALVVAQIAFAVLLIFAGGLLLRSFAAVMKVQPGFATDKVLTLRMAATQDRYPTKVEIADYYHRLLTRVETVPGVEAAGMVSHLPLSDERLSGPVYFEGWPNDRWIGADSRSATPGYFAAMGIPLKSGRTFTDDDVAGAPLVAILDEQLAETAFGDEDPLGKRIRFGVVNESTPWVEIVGVVGHIKNHSLESDPRPQVYWPMGQETHARGALVVKTAGRPQTFIAPVVEEIRNENPDQAVYDVRSMAEQVEVSLRSRNLLTGLMALLSASSLLLACLGLYGVVSYGTRLRLREFALRMVVGARPGDILRLVLKHAGLLALTGSVIGLLAAQPTGRALESQLYGVGSTDLVALLAAPVLLLVTALLAALAPARRARRVEPAEMLRSE